MIRINTLEHCGETLTIEIMGSIDRPEFDILYDFLQSQVEEGVAEVCIVAKEVRSINPFLDQETTSLGQLGLKLRFQQLPFALKHTLEYWGLEDWVDDE